MHETAQKIVSVFRKTGTELSTSKILEYIDEEYSFFVKALLASGNDKKIEIKRKIAKIHRKVLHHLNKLVDSGIIGVVKHGEKGEKFFSLKIGENEELLEISPKYKKRIIISKPSVISIPIEGYEQKEIVLKYEPATWIDRINSVVLFSKKLDFNELYDSLIEKIFPIINDSINIENFEEYMNNYDVSGFLEKINIECEDYGKLINLNIHLGDLIKEDSLIVVLKLLSANSLKNIRFIFCLNNEITDKESKVLSMIIEIFSKKRKELYIKNSLIQKSPYFSGRAGPYGFVDKEWFNSEDLIENMVCLCCAQSSAIVDVNKFYLEHGLDINKFSELMFNISKSMLSANSIQRRRTDDLFRSVNSLNKNQQANFLNLSRNYIRIWNFGMHQPDINQEFVFNMINEAKKKINEFSSAEETIYKSCGMTTRFKLALSPAFETVGKVSSAKYLPLEIKEVDDLYSKYLRKTLHDREAASQIFDGGNEVTFHIIENIEIENFIKQINILLSNYKIPLLSFNFTKMKGDTKLSQFLR